MSLSLADIEAAATRIAGHAVRTPLIEGRAASAATGARIFVKPEVLQRTGLSLAPLDHPNSACHPSNRRA